MAINLFYAGIVFLADVIGAFSGLGGGMIIKPAMGLFHQLSLKSIVLYSSIAVFSMSIVSVLKTEYNMHKLHKHLDWMAILFFGIGGVIGGFLGDIFLQKSFKLLSSVVINNIQVVMMILIIMGALWYQFYQKSILHLQNHFAQLIFGVFLGMISAMLGIGGGPLNVWLLMMLVGYGLKEATIYSLGIVFFSTGSHLLTAFFKGEFSALNTTILFFIIPAAIIGGWLGTVIKHKIDIKLMRKIYIIMLALVLILNICNFEY